MPQVYAGTKTRATLRGVRSPVWLVLAVVLAACSTPQETKSQVEVLQKIPHDTSAFTQGLELVDGVLYEGTGLEGQSTMRALDPATGDVQKKVDLPQELFGEGITVVDETIWQITWRNGVAIERDRKTLDEIRRVSYEGEGWGICQDDQRLIMSDGSAKLTFRDPKSFKETGSVQVTRDGKPLDPAQRTGVRGGQGLGERVEDRRDRPHRPGQRSGRSTPTTCRRSSRPIRTRTCSTASRTCPEPTSSWSQARTGRPSSE